MIYLLIGIGILFVSIGFLVTENNARYLLSGYNMMSKEDQKKVALKPYLQKFRKFHLFLGFSFSFLGIALIYFTEELAAQVFMVAYPILAYIYFVTTNLKTFKTSKKL